MTATRPDATAHANAARAALARLDRRRFLSLGIAATGATLLPAGCGGVPDSLRPRADVALRQLSPRGYATCTAADQRLTGPAAAAAIARPEIDVGTAVDRWVDREPGLAGAVTMALTALEWGIPPWVPKWRPFTGQSERDQDRILAALMEARLDVSRDIFRGIRSLVFVAVYSDPKGVRLTHFPGPFGSAEVGIADAMTYDVGR